MALLTEVCGDDLPRLAAALAGVRAYQQHPYRRTLAPMPEVARLGAVGLRDYGGTGPMVVFVPSLINPPTVLDLDADNSLLRWLATRGVHPLLVDWGDHERHFGLTGLIEERLAPLIAGLGGAPAVVGYCLGGTLALAAAVRTPVSRVALLAAPWRFDGYTAAQLTAVAQFAATTRTLAEALGCLPMDLVQPGFWALDRDTVAAKFVAFAAVGPDSAKARAFVALEDWANEGPPLPLGVARDLFDDLFAANLTGRGDWPIPGVPILDIVSRRDRIVPAGSALGVGERLEVDAGHIGMVVGSRARSQLWEPLARFLRGD